MIGVAVIGTGAIAPRHLEAYQAFSARAEIRALVDIVPEHARDKAAAFNLAVPVYEDYQAVLADPAIQLVSIATPPATHAEIAIACLKAGKHVLVEKPMAASLAECDAMIQAAHDHHRWLSVVAQNRFRTPMMRLKKVLDQGLIGRVLHVAVDSYWWRGPQYYDLWWRGTWASEGGGVTLNHAVHHIDALQWMMGPAESVTARMQNVAHPNAEVEDLSIAILTFAQGALGQITSSVVHHGQAQQIQFQGERAAIGFPWQVVAESAQPNGFPKRHSAWMETIQRFYDSLPELSYEQHFGQIDDVLTAIEQNTPPLVDGNSGRRTIELITAIYTSATLGRFINLPLTPDSAFYQQADLLRQVPHFHEKTVSVNGFIDNDITT
jgi:predicted dehydrogenase